MPDDGRPVDILGASGGAALDDPGRSSARGRLYMLAAAVLWSVAGVVTKRLDLDSGSIAVYRSLFAGLALLLVVPPRRWAFRPVMAPLGLAFGAMIGLYLGGREGDDGRQRDLPPVHGAVLDRPAGLIFLKERPTAAPSAGSPWRRWACWRSSATAIRPGEGAGVALALASGVAYAAVVVGLRGLRDLDPLWLSAFNNLVGALALAAWLYATGAGLARPTPGQAVTLVAFGVLQMAIPYALFARGLRDVPAAEAGLIGLVEPVLAPIWVALFHGETPAVATILGGAILLSGVAVRYWPTKARRQARRIPAGLSWAMPRPPGLWRSAVLWGSLGGLLWGVGSARRAKPIRCAAKPISVTLERRDAFPIMARSPDIPTRSATEIPARRPKPIPVAGPSSGGATARPDDARSRPRPRRAKPIPRAERTRHPPPVRQGAGPCGSGRRARRRLVAGFPRSTCSSS